MSIPVVDQLTEEKVVTLTDITWEQFKGIEANLQNNPNVGLFYLAGVLEIMSPIGEKHEKVKSTFSLLLETYMRELDIRFYKRGGFTLEEPGYASGTPDESYSIGIEKEIPDIVIEVIITSGTINRKELYKPKKVPEIWFWKSNSISIFSLSENGEYKEVNRSKFFPDLDPSLLLRYVAMVDQYDAVIEFQQMLRHQLS